MKVHRREVCFAKEEIWFTRNYYEDVVPIYAFSNGDGTVIQVPMFSVDENGDAVSIKKEAESAVSMVTMAHVEKQFDLFANSKSFQDSCNKAGEIYVTIVRTEADPSKIGLLAAGFFPEKCIEEAEIKSIFGEEVWLQCGEAQ
jgi:hypothetical protein